MNLGLTLCHEECFINDRNITPTDFIEDLEIIVNSFLISTELPGLIGC